MAGIFVLNDQMSTDEILRVLNDPAQARTDQLLITFPEGRWAKGLCGADRGTAGHRCG
ncbi:MAG: hypothetical protein ACLVJ6_12585 [Merdibacter sp.]